MNIVRKIKLESLGYYVCKDNNEKELFKFIKDNFYDLEKVEITKFGNNIIYYIKNNAIIFSENSNSYYLIKINPSLIWWELENRFKFNYNETRELLSLIVKDICNIKDDIYVTSYFSLM